MHRGDVDFRGERRANETHASTTDPEALLARKGPGREAKLCFVGHVLMDNRNGLVVDVQITRPPGQRNGTRPWRCCERCRVAGASLLGRIRGMTRKTS